MGLFDGVAELLFRGAKELVVRPGTKEQLIGGNVKEQIVGGGVKELVIGGAAEQLRGRASGSVWRKP
jgi:hypothetical protein